MQLIIYLMGIGYSKAKNRLTQNVYFFVLMFTMIQEILVSRKYAGGAANETSSCVLHDTLRTRFRRIQFAIWGHFYKHGLTSIPTWMSNHMPSKDWDEITYPFPNFNGCTVDSTIYKWV